jgi:hypothetical protein
LKLSLGLKLTCTLGRWSLVVALGRGPLVLLGRWPQLRRSDQLQAQ